MILGIEANSKVGVGGYADVFRSSSGLAVKVFRRATVVEEPVEDERDHEIALHEICESECEAFDLVTADANLSRFIPSGFQRVSVSDIVADNGVSIAHKYILDAAYQMELIEGIAVKSTDPKLGRVWNDISSVLDKFRVIGVDYVLDSSVFVPGSRAPFTLIDFAKRDSVADLQFALSAYGRLPERYRIKWGRADAG